MYRATLPSQWVFAQIMNHENRSHQSNVSSGGCGPKYAVQRAYYNYSSHVEMVPLLSLEAHGLMSKPPPVVPRRSTPVGISVEICGREKPVHWNSNNSRVRSGSCGVSSGHSSVWTSGVQYKRDYQQNVSSGNNSDKLYLNSQGTQAVKAASSATSGSPELLIVEISPSTPSVVPSLVNKGVKRRLDVSPVANSDYSNRINTSLSSSCPSSLKCESEIIYVGTKRKPNYERYDTPLRNDKPTGVAGGGENSASSSSSQQQQQQFIAPSRIVLPLTNGLTIPSKLLNGGNYDKLSIQVWNKFMSCKQSDEMFEKKMRLHGVLTRIIKESYPSCGLYVVGSSMNTFGTNKSDMDACLMLTASDIDQRTDALNILYDVLQVIRNFEFFVKAELIRAKVPIVEFKDTVSGVEVDLNINNAVGIRNTYLLRAYSNLDWRVCPLVLIVKIWARIHDINDAKNMTISSYSLALMVIHFLQCGITPAILPCLQKLFPHKFLPELDVRTLSLDEKFQVPQSQNSQSLGQLLWSFFDYYTKEFDFQEEAISVRLGRKVPKHFVKYQNARKNSPGMWNCLCIEEPFDMTNTARSVYDDDVFQRIRSVFMTSYTRLTRTKDLQSIL